MRIVFMGTPQFAAVSLEQLYNDNYDVAAVFTQADKPRNRGMKLSYSPVKELALSHGTDVFQPATLKDGKAAEIIKGLSCELIVVVAYGKILPNEILDIPPLGCINIHGSLLPKYRGAAPIQHAIINGEKETGVTSQYVTEEVDAGDIILYKKTNIGDDETSADLFHRLGLLGAELLGETVDAIAKGIAKRIPQSNADVTYAPLLTKDISAIDWRKSAGSIKNLVRGLIPWPIATMKLNETTLKVFSVDTDNKVTEHIPGSIITNSRDGLKIACADGCIIVKEVQAPGGKRMSSADYLRGNPIGNTSNIL